MMLIEVFRNARDLLWDVPIGVRKASLAGDGCPRVKAHHAAAMTACYSADLIGIQEVRKHVGLAVEGLIEALCAGEVKGRDFDAALRTYETVLTCMDEAEAAYR